MGKVRARKKSRVHLRAPKPAGAGHENEESSKPENVATCTRAGDCGPEPMAGVQIVPLPEEIMQSLPVVPLFSCGDGGQRGEKGGGALEQKEPVPQKKKDKRKLRHERWLQKLEGCRAVRDSTRAAERRKKTVVVGDMQPLAAALPVLPMATGGELEESKQDATLVRKAKSKPRTLLSEVDHFQKVLEHPAFKADPLATIAQHIQNAVAAGKT